MKKLMTAAAIAVACAVPAFAETPEEFVQKTYDALEAKEFEKVASFYSEEAITDFRKSFAFLNELPPQMAQGFYGQIFGEDATPESVKEVSDQAFFAKFLPLVFSTGPEEEVDYSDLEILGSLEKEDMAYVITRDMIEAGQEESVEVLNVVSLKQTDDTYTMQLPAELKVLPMRMQQNAMMQQQRMQQMQMMQQQQQQQQQQPQGATPPVPGAPAGSAGQ